MAEANTEAGSWVRRFHPSDDAATRLICFPHAGGSAPFYFPVSRTMSPKVDVLAIQYPGRQDRRFEPCLDSVADLADGLLPELLGWLDRPFTLFGHSLGATLGFEAALRLEARGLEPTALFASGRRAPSRFRPDESVHRYSDDDIIAELGRLSGTDSRVLGDPELLRMILPAIRSDYRAAETYRFPEDGPRLACAVHVLTGDADPHVTRDEANAWRGHTDGPFRLQVFTGGHFYLNDHAPEVMGAISGHLAELSASGRS